MTDGRTESQTDNAGCYVAIATENVHHISVDVSERI